MLRFWIEGQLLGPVGASFRADFPLIKGLCAAVVNEPELTEYKLRLLDRGHASITDDRGKWQLSQRLAYYENNDKMVLFTFVGDLGPKSIEMLRILGAHIKRVFEAHFGIPVEAEILLSL